MEIHQLRYFVAVADEGSFSRAAAREHVAQPSLSQQIQKLEAEMDQRLFDRLPRSVVVTEAGRCLLDYARKILIQIGDAHRCVDELKRDVVGRLAVGAIPTIALYVLPALIGKFQRRYPKVILNFMKIQPTLSLCVWRTGRSMLCSLRPVAIPPLWSAIR
jgi:LysR family transcriptional regulator, hydrogen peroxide-inducible genes activator